VRPIFGELLASAHPVQYLHVADTVICTNITAVEIRVSVHIGRCTLRKNWLWWWRTTAGSKTTATNAWMHRPDMAATCAIW